MRHRILIVGLAAILLTAVGAVFGLHRGESPDANTAQASNTLTPGQAPADQLAVSIAGLIIGSGARDWLTYYHEWPIRKLIGASASSEGGR